MPDNLPPELRQQFEHFLRQVRAGALPVFPTTESIVDQVAELARRVLAGDSEQPIADFEAAVGHAEAVLPLWWWRGWNDLTSGGPGRTRTEKLHQRLAHYGESVVVGWLAHPAVEPILKGSRANLRELSFPLLMIDQKAVTYITAALLGYKVLRPDGTSWPDPFADCPAWYRVRVEQHGAPFVAALQTLAQTIADAGAPLDPHDHANWVALSQLALGDLDLSRNPAEIANDLNTLPPGWFDLPAALQGHVATHISRHGRAARFQTDMSKAAELAARRLGEPPLRRPYAGGKPRRKPSIEHVQARRRKALRQVIEKFPGATSSRIRRTWERGPATEGGLLRTKLGLQPHDTPPSDSTVRNDLNEIRQRTRRHV